MRERAQLQLEPPKTMVTVSKKIERREAKRELKALRAANIEKSIEQELMERLRQVRQRLVLLVLSPHRLVCRAPMVTFTTSRRRPLTRCSTARSYW